MPEKSEKFKAYLPMDSEAKKKVAALKSYIKSISEIFPDAEKPTISTKVIVNPGWEEKWKKYFKPVRISKNIIIKPTWERHTPSGRDIVIDIDPGMAFGTGQHPSTSMCISAVEDIMLNNELPEKWNAIDVGTGTGIIAICCAKLGAESVVAVDIDPKAVEIAGKNTTINGTEDKIKVINSDISACSGRFDMVVANLTSTTLINTYSHLISLAKPGGYIIASGIINQEAENVKRVFSTEETSFYGENSEEEWVCYVFKKR
jgi:ribosomal protein L11 methyltransferase